VSDFTTTPSTGLTLGRCDEMRAEVLLRPGSTGEPATMTGTLSGPQRGRDTTLPVTARLEPTGTPGLFRAILTEPAYWTPDLPNLYRLRATITASDRSPQQRIDTLLGLRRLGVRGRSLWLDGHRWVPRAVAPTGVAGVDACKPAALAALVAEPDEATLARADAIGVAVLARVNASAADHPAVIADRIAAWSAHPSAVLAILPAQMPAATVAEVAQAIRGRKDTLLLAATVAGTDPPPTTIPPGIDAVVVSLCASELPHDAWRTGTATPVIAWRHLDRSPAMSRAPCDALQAALARWAARDSDARPWDWAGYIVG
jgi:hypothetical protein